MEPLVRSACLLAFGVEPGGEVKSEEEQLEGGIRDGRLWRMCGPAEVTLYGKGIVSV